MQHFLDISQLPYDLANKLILRAIKLKKMVTYPQYASNKLINLFYENSTRTRVSFELAAKNLGINVINLDLNTSSENKGEVTEDTINTLSAMGINLFVIRHQKNGFPHTLANELKGKSHIINAGDGTNSHPSQALLDFMTIFEYNPNYQNLKIAIVGDILHSRVANSLQSLCALFSVKNLQLIAPKVWHPKELHYGTLTTSLQEGLEDADVIIALRVQQERLSKDTKLDLIDYNHNFGLNKNTIKFAKKNAMIMHPGPINRGVEIDSDIADGPNSFILKQVENGIYMRMAIIESFLNHSPF